MDQERLRWITPRPTLDDFEIRVSLAETPSGLLATVWAAGYCRRKRGTIWTHSETIAVETDRYAAGDLIHHLALCSLQDRPNSNAALTRALIGSAWDQPELPF